MEKTFWFWAWIVQITVPKARLKQPSAKGEAWRNLILVSGRGEAEAIQKAIEVGRSLRGDDNGSLTLDGKPARTIFLGVEDMGLIHDLLDDDLRDGVEVLFQMKRTTRAVEKKHLKPKKEIRASLARQLASARGSFK